jgi:hypothetical protein
MFTFFFKNSYLYVLTFKYLIKSCHSSSLKHTFRIMLRYMHASTHNHVHTYIHTYMHAYAACTHTHVHTCMHEYIHIYVLHVCMRMYGTAKQT